MEKINFEMTGGQFGVRRVLGTFTLETLPNGRIGVCDDHQNGKMVGFGYKTAQDAQKAFQSKDDARLVM